MTTKDISSQSGAPLAKGGFQSRESETHDDRALEILLAGKQARTVCVAATGESLKPGSRTLGLS